MFFRKEIGSIVFHLELIDFLYLEFDYDIKFKVILTLG